jgi:single-stranded-DNA-specific exonuclease
LSHFRWNLLPQLDEQRLNHPGFSPLLVQLFYNRGITNPGGFTKFLASDGSLLNDPLLLPDAREAVARIYRALLSGEKIAVYGDYDADGMTATAAFVLGLRALGGTAVPYIPHRQTEGHGLAIGALKTLREQGVSLVVTVDCGVTDAPQVKKANAMGLDVIITDHHTPLDNIPDAIAVVDPKLADSAYPFSQLAGVGVAFKVLQALYRSLGKDDRLDWLLDLVAIGTISDMSPPLAENRYLIVEGLKRINDNPRLGINELLKQTRLEAGSLDSDSISWIIGPCLNAAGRMADGLTGYNLLVTESPQEAAELAAWLAKKNRERQEMTTRILAMARQSVIDRGLQPLLMTADKNYPIGIAGLVAGRLAEEFYRPAIVIHIAEKQSHASCRSIPEFNMIEALNRFSHLFSRFGGHSQAAGFTMSTSKLPELEEGLLELAAGQLEGVELMPHLNIDARINLTELAGDAFQSIQSLSPFGIGNPVPSFLSRGVEVLEKRTMGNNGEHLRLKLRQDDSVWDCVAFRLSNHQNELSSRLDIVYNVEVDNWGGKNRLRLNILDFKSSA